MTYVSMKSLVAAACLVFTLAVQAPAQPLKAQGALRTALPQRFSEPIANSSRVTLPGSRPPLAIATADAGAVPPTTKLQGISLVFNRTAAQQADLDALVLAQQQTSSPLYHQWLNPDQFAARFGVSDADIATVENWLQLQGFSIDSVSRSRDRIFFSGTAALVASAFGAPLHYFKYAATATQPAATHIAPASDLTLPSALAANVLAINNLSDFRPHSRIVHSPQAVAAATATARPAFTSSQTGSHFITPGDIATIYDITPAYSAGFTGANQSIAVLGQSAVTLADIAAFQSAAGIAGKTPVTVLVPNSGPATLYTGDEAESDLDLEYTSTIAKGAQVYFVYTGATSTYGVFDSLNYAVDEKIAPIVSISYGDCEADLGQTYYNLFNGEMEQGVAQGQTFIAAAGDSGSTDCYGISDTVINTVAEQEALAVDFPASSQYVTGMGGTEFSAADVAIGNNTYFTAQGTADTISSALSYIPEAVWNDDATYLAGGSTSPFAAGGGGVSIFTPRPTWQAGTIGGVAIASGTFRLIPDISLDASPVNAPLAYCSSDQSAWNTAANGGTPPYQAASCNTGFRDASSGDLTIAGGTSFDAPIFAGMLALINQSLNSTGQGLVNPTLYTLAASSSTYGSVFHDITSGNNACGGGTAYCSTAGAASFSASTGYDEASGLGSIDLYKLLTAWPQPAGTTLAATSTTLTAATLTPAINASDVITITVAQTSGTSIPTGSVTISVDGSTTTTSVALTGGVATYTFSSATTGAHIITATYSGDTVNAASSGTLALNVIPAGTFAISATSVTVASGSSANSVVTVTPAGGYTGTVDLGLNIPTNLTDVCATDTNGGIITITGTTAGTDTITLYTSLSTCNSLGLSTEVHAGKGGARILPITRRRLKLASTTPHRSPWKQLPLPTALAGLVMLFSLRRRANRNLLRIGLSLLVVAMLSVSGLGLTACSSSESASKTVTTAGDTPAGTYTVQVIGTDSVTSLTSSTNVTLTVN